MFKKCGKGLALLVFLTWVLSGCVFSTRPDQMQEYSHLVLQEDTQSAEINLRMGAGELSVYSGSMNLMDAFFIYNVASWKPLVSYQVKESRGNLTVEQPSGSWKNVNLRGMKYVWDIRLGSEIPLDLKIEMGAGQGYLDLRSLHLNSLDVVMGAGEVSTDLRGYWPESFQANIKGGVGKATVLLPQDTGVKVYVKGGLGTVSTWGLTREGDAYVNDAYKTSTQVITLSIEGGVGELNLRVERETEQETGSYPYDSLMREDIRDIEFFSPSARTPVSSQSELLEEIAALIRSAEFVRKTSNERASTCSFGAFITLKNTVAESRTLTVCYNSGEGDKLALGPQGNEFIVLSRELAEFILSRID